MSNQSGVSIIWSAEHRDGKGKLISKQGTISSPPALTCLKQRFIRQFIRDSIYYLFLINYHKQRVNYCERNRDKGIPNKYRTGEGFSKSILGIINDNIILGLRRVF